MDDFASVPRAASTRSPCLPCSFTNPNGTSRVAQTSPASSVVTCKARKVPAGTVTDSQPPTCAPLRRALGADPREAQLAATGGARPFERRPLTHLRVAQRLADIRQVGRGLGRERGRRQGREREQGARAA